MLKEILQVEVCDYLDLQGPLLAKEVSTVVAH